MAFKYGNKTRNNNSNTQQEREPSEYDGIYLNLGVPMEVEGEEVFARIPHRAIALADLELLKVTQRTRRNNPAWAKQADTVNAIINALRKGGLELEEGEGAPLKLSVQMFRAESDEGGEPETDVEINVEDIFG